APPDAGAVPARCARPRRRERTRGAPPRGRQGNPAAPPEPVGRPKPSPEPSARRVPSLHTSAACLTELDRRGHAKSRAYCFHHAEHRGVFGYPDLRIRLDFHIRYLGQGGDRTPGASVVLAADLQGLRSRAFGDYFHILVAGSRVGFAVDGERLDLGW